MLLIICLCPIAFANDRAEVYQVEKKFGLKSGNIELTKPEYSKIIKLGDNAWIVQKRTDTEL